MRPRRLRDFHGVWTLDREIVHADGRRALVAGVSDWQPEGPGLAQQEQGEMRMQGHRPLSVTRRYLWRRGPLVRFADGRFFHHVPPLGGATAHWCDPDQYDGQYDFTGWPAFSVTWRVRGPRKDYRMVTRYAPVAPQGAP